jgi:hypothetical protein
MTVAPARRVCEYPPLIVAAAMTNYARQFPVILTSARAAAGMTSRARRPEFLHTAG